MTSDFHGHDSLDETEPDRVVPYEPQLTDDEGDDVTLLPTRTTWHRSDSLAPMEVRRHQRRCLQNLLLHSVSVMLITVPYTTLQQLKVNLLTQTGGFLALVVSCFLAPLVVHLLGYKRTMVVTFGVHTLFVLSNLVPGVSAVFPTFVLLGLAHGPFWTAQGSYVSLLASEYAEYSHTDLRATTCGFFGLFFTFFHFSKVLGRPLAYYLLDEKFVANYVNSTEAQESQRLGNGSVRCGAEFCAGGLHQSDLPPHAYDSRAVTAFTLIYLAFCLLALLVKLLLVDDKRPLRGVPAMGTCELLRSTVYMHCKETMVLVLPLFVYVGFEQLFLYRDFLWAYIRCAMGFRHVGPTILTVSLTETGATLVIGFLQKYPKCRISLMEIGSFVNLVLLGVARSSDVHTWNVAHFYIFSVCWGVCDAIWQTSTCAMVSVLFPHCRSPAFATLRLWQSLAVGAGFSLNRHTCVGTQLSWYIGLLVAATLAYTVMERRYKKRSLLPFVNLYTPVEPGNDHVTLYLQRFLSY